VLIKLLSIAVRRTIDSGSNIPVVVVVSCDNEMNAVDGF
jgi:hypothetical protein